MSSIDTWTFHWATSKGLKTIHHHELKSTNDLAKKEFGKCEIPFCLYLTSHQTGGRGRGEHIWTDSGKGNFLLSTWCFKNSFVAQPILTPLLGLAVFDALKKISSSLTLRLKAPNDIFLDNKKLCGLLVEASSQGESSELYIGLGMNIFSSPKVDLPTTHLSQSLEIEETLWTQLCTELYQNISSAVKKSQSSKLNDSDRKALLNALNQTGADPQYDEVLPDGSLKSKDQMTSWQNL